MGGMNRVSGGLISMRRLGNNGHGNGNENYTKLLRGRSPGIRSLPPRRWLGSTFQKKFPEFCLLGGRWSAIERVYLL